MAIKIEFDKKPVNKWELPVGTFIKVYDEAVYILTENKEVVSLHTGHCYNLETISDDFQVVDLEVKVLG